MKEIFDIQVESKTIRFTKKGPYVDIEIMQNGITEEQIWLFDDENIKLFNFYYQQLTLNHFNMSAKMKPVPRDEEIPTDFQTMEELIGRDPSPYRNKQTPEEIAKERGPMWRLGVMFGQCVRRVV